MRPDRFEAVTFSRRAYTDEYLAASGSCMLVGGPNHGWWNRAQPNIPMRLHSYWLPCPRSTLPSKNIPFNADKFLHSKNA